MTQLKMLTADDKLAEIRRLYFSTTKQTIQADLTKALDLLKSMTTEEERERAKAECEPGGNDRKGRAPGLQRLQRAEPGGDPDCIRIGAREERPASRDRERTGRPAGLWPPPTLDERREESGRDDHGRDCEWLVAHEGRGEVVEQAVGEERVVARVPVRVPEEHSVANELGAVEVGRKVAGRRPEESQGKRHRGGDERAASGLRPDAHP